MCGWSFSLCILVLKMSKTHRESIMTRTISAIKMELMESMVMVLSSEKDNDSTAMNLEQRQITFLQ